MIDRGAKGLIEPGDERFELTSQRAAEFSTEWASTMAGNGQGPVRIAHNGSPVRVEAERLDRTLRAGLTAGFLAPGATPAIGGGNRAIAEPADRYRDCFEKDRDRIVHSRAFRRLAGKTQVFVFPADHERTRLTHALEVAQVATSVARATGLNVALTEAIALGHDCGHGPGGHASEAVFDVFVPGFHHATWGADVVLSALNLCSETLDGIGHHSWSLPAPSTPEGAVVSWADRVAYCAHDLEDAVVSGIVHPADLPPLVSSLAGESRSRQLDYFINALIDGIVSFGVIGMAEVPAGCLEELRAFNYERIYNRRDSVVQGETVAKLLFALVSYFVEHPDRLEFDPIDRDDPVRAAVRYVDGMTDRYAFALATELLGLEASCLPRGIGGPVRRLTDGTGLRS